MAADPGMPNLDFLDQPPTPEEQELMRALVPATEPKAPPPAEPATPTYDDVVDDQAEALASSQRTAERMLDRAEDEVTTSAGPAAAAALQATIDRQDWARKSDSQVRRSLGEKVYDALGVLDPITGPARLTLARIWREAGKPGIPASLDEAGQTLDAIRHTPSMESPIATALDAAPVLGMVRRGMGEVAGIVSGDSSAGDDIHPAAAVGQVLSTGARPIAAFATEAQRWQYVSRAFEQSRRFRELREGGAKVEPSAQGERILDPDTGEYSYDRVRTETETSPDGAQHRTIRYIRHPETGEKLERKTKTEIWRDVAQSIIPEDDPADDPSWTDAVQYAFLNQGWDARSRKAQAAILGLGILGDIAYDPANLLTFGEKSALRAGKQIEKVMARSYERMGDSAPQAARKAKALGEFAAEMWGRDAELAPEVVGRAVSSPEHMAGFQRLLSVRQTALATADELAARAERAAQEALESGAAEDLVRQLRGKAEGLRRAAETAEDAVAELAGRAASGAPEQLVTTKRDVLRTLSSAVAAAGDTQAAAEIEALGYRWGVGGLEVGLGKAKYEVLSRTRGQDHEAAVRRAAQRLADPEATPSAVAAAATAAVQGIAIPDPDDYTDVLRVADVLLDRHTLRLSDDIRQASDLAWKAKRAPMELEHVYEVTQYPYRRGAEVGPMLVADAAEMMDPLLPDRAHRKEFARLFSEAAEEILAEQAAPEGGIKEVIQRAARQAASRSGAQGDRAAAMMRELEKRADRLAPRLEATRSDWLDHVRRGADSVLAHVMPASRKKMRGQVGGAVARAERLVLDPDERATLERAAGRAYAKAMIHGGADGAAEWWQTHAADYIADAMGREHLVAPRAAELEDIVASGLVTLPRDAATHAQGLAGLDDGLRHLHGFVRGKMETMAARERALGIPLKEIDDYLPLIARRAEETGDLHFLERPGTTLGKKPRFAKHRLGDAVSDPVTNVLQGLAYREQAHHVAAKKHEFLGEMARRFGRRLKDGERPAEGTRAISRYVDGQLVWYEVPQHVARGIQRVEELWAPDKLTGLLHGLSQVQNFWKSRVTVGRLPFHTRNIFSNYLLMHQAGVEAPAIATVQGMMVSMAGLKGKRAQADLIRKAMGRGKASRATAAGRAMADRLIALGETMAAREVTSRTGQRYTYGRLDGLARELGVVDSGWAAADITADALRDFDRSPGYTPARNLLKAAQLVDPTGLSTLADGSKKMRSDQWLLVRLGAQGGRYIENSARMGTFLDLVLRRGFSPQDAASEVKRVLFDYSAHSLTSTERQIKVVAPFYTWLRRNLPYQLEQAVRRPGKSSAQYKAWHAIDRMYEQHRAALEDEDQYIPRQDLPEWTRAQMAARMDHQPFGRDLQGSLFLWMPGYTINDLNSLSPEGAAGGLLGQLTPMIKAPLELLRGKRIMAQGEYEGPLSSMQEVSPTMATVGEWLGLEVRKIVDKQSDAPHYVMPAIGPYLLSLLVPDIADALRYFPEVASPEEGPVPLTPRQAAQADTSRRGLVPGFAGRSHEALRGQQDAVRRGIGTLKAALPRPGYEYLPTPSERERERRRREVRSFLGRTGVPPTATE